MVSQTILSAHLGKLWAHIPIESILGTLYADLATRKVGKICNSALKIELCVHFWAVGIFGLCKQHDQPELETKTPLAWQEYREVAWAASDWIRETKLQRIKSGQGYQV